MTRQEMFDMAIRGLAKQGWRRAVKKLPNGEVVCVYSDPTSDRRCAWGHVDTALHDRAGGVRHLREEGAGIAAELDLYDLNFASEMQSAHDEGVDPEGMLAAFIDLCKYNRLVWPADVPTVIG